MLEAVHSVRCSRHSCARQQPGLLPRSGHAGLTSGMLAAAGPLCALVAVRPATLAPRSGAAAPPPTAHPGGAPGGRLLGCWACRGHACSPAAHQACQGRQAAHTQLSLVCIAGSRCLERVTCTTCLSGQHSTADHACPASLGRWTVLPTQCPGLQPILYPCMVPADCAQHMCWDHDLHCPPAAPRQSLCAWSSSASARVVRVMRTARATGREPADPRGNRLGKQLR